MTGFLKLASIVGLLLTIPICAFIYMGVDGLERRASSVKELRELQNFVNGFRDFAVENSNPDVKFPVRRTLENKDGQKLESIIVARSESELSIISMVNNQHYSYSISSLSDNDIDFVMDLPVYLKSPSEYPVVRNLRLLKGEAITAVVLGRDQFELTYRLIGEISETTLSINQLTPKSRRSVYSLPVSF